MASAAVSCCSGYTYADHLTVLKGFCDKADSKDKLTALIQFACLFLSAGQDGKLKKIQASVTAARKVFRVLRPLEALTPVLVAPGFTGKEPVLLQAINKIKAALMSMYFFGDHITWAYAVGLISDKATNDRWGKISQYSWMAGSICTAVAEAWGIARLSVVRKDGESDEEYNKRVEAVRGQINSKLFVLVHGLVQAVLAASLLGLVQAKPRTIGLMGMVASTMNCYLLYPSYPVKAAPKKTA